MNEPILGKSHPHPWDYKPIVWGEFLKLKNSCQKVSDALGYPIYLVGSALHKDIPRDIDISVIIPIEDYEKHFGKLPEKQEEFGEYLAKIMDEICFVYTELIDLQFCIDYHLDIKFVLIHGGLKSQNFYWLNRRKLIQLKMNSVQSVVD
jgi:predicted nucleotidyltransferase